MTTAAAHLGHGGWLRRTPAFLLALALLGAAARPAEGSAAASVPPDTSSTIGLFAPDWKQIHRTEAQWAAAATAFDIYIGTKEEYASHLPALRAANPNALVLMYNLGPYLLRDSPIYAEVMSTHPEYFARDTHGNLITVRQQPQQTLMDQGNPGWRALHAARVAGFVNTFGFDGADLDSMGWGAVRGYTTAPPVNRVTQAPYTVQEWLEQSVLTLNAVKSALGSKILIFNGLINGPSYATTSILTTSAADGAIAEGFVRDATSSIRSYPSTAAWLSNLHMAEDMAERGKMFLAWTKTWTTATDSQRQAWNTFALATYLLVKGKRTYYNFLPSAGVDRSKVFYPDEQAELGAPLGSYTVTGSVYTRQFEHGTVTVNPPAHTASITLT